MSKPITDLYLVAYLQVLGRKLLKSEKKEKKTIFYFDDAVIEDITKYFSHQAQVDPLSLSEALKSLKSFVKIDS